MKYYYLSGVSHIPHYYQIQKKIPDLIPITLSKEVVQYFGDKCYVENLAMGHQGYTHRIPLQKINRAAQYLVNKYKIDKFIFNERLIDLNGIYLATRLVHFGVKNVIYYEDCTVTKYYKSAQFSKLSAWAYMSWLKNTIKYFNIPIRWYETHDGIYLGVSKVFLKETGILVEEFTEKSDRNPLFRGSQTKIHPHKKKNGKVVIALGYSIKDDLAFMDAKEKEKIYKEILSSIPNSIVKYHPNSQIPNEFLGSNEINRSRVIEEYVDDISIVISDYSLALINLSQLGIKSISILDMVKIRDEEKYRFWKEYLSLSAPNILFPKSIIQLIKACEENN